jgi:hypothetical protein
MKEICKEQLQRIKRHFPILNKIAGKKEPCHSRSYIKMGTKAAKQARP